ncbi:MAG: methylated-DNA--[protein]-cysteine S-methyltransferase [Streptosporangiales bacterium]|nr:methylated-DNA--[protein]-cysteine S-methyltransferase [Streptosporangiales bacterium]
MDSPIGDLVLTGDGRALLRIDLLADVPLVPGAVPAASAAVLGEAAGQLRAYFAGERVAFALPVALEGTEFRRVVWRRIAEIPYGATATYGDLARDLGRPRAARAVGAANGANPLPIVLPCHRVIGASGDLIKYGLGGLPNKRRLLDLERAGHTA